MKIQVDPMITHTMPLADINKGFDLHAPGQEHPQRGGLLRAKAGSRRMA